MSFRLAPGSLPWVAAPFAASVLVYPMSSALSLILLLVTAFMIHFHRDPERFPEGDGMVSPADGRIVDADEKHIYIFMGPMDVHVNRSPLDGVVRSVEFRSGEHSPAFRHPLKNAHSIIDIESETGRFTLKQISGMAARRVVCWVSPGDRLKRGQRIGMIRFGSGVIVTAPPGYRITARRGERVRAGQTVIAERSE
ncbi:MAG: phosphatidylserine decarboxylase [Methanothrix sp.]|nr:phosphatidylserine decarboxylase [Methanothrix sp.]MCX8206387.1 phosphatidylserine decarboxylase [Methanothrix sp.]